MARQDHTNRPVCARAVTTHMRTLIREQIRGLFSDDDEISHERHREHMIDGNRVHSRVQMRPANHTQGV
jgi:hypothetical protein